MKHLLDNRPKRQPLAFETLEPRLLLSADLAPALAPSEHDAPPPIPAEHRALEALAELPRIAMAQELSRVRELVFVDAGLPDYQRLVATVQRVTGSEREVEVVLLDPSRDGVAQIGEALAGRSGLAAVHLVTHGGDGRLQIGGTTLDASALERNRDAIAAWSRAFAPDGDLLLYGCDVAETPQGEAFIDALAQLTGADVAASNDRTGAATRLGGDWDLERTTGVVETAAAFSSAIDAVWVHALATETLDWDAVAASGTNPYPASALTWTSDAIGGGDASFSLSGDTVKLTAGPVVDQFNEGGTAPVENSLHISLDLDNDVQQVVWTIDFSHPDGVSNVGFTIFDIDVGGFVDQVTVTSDRGVPVVAGSVNNSVSGNTVTGVTTTPQTGMGSDSANGAFFFAQSGITQITITYEHGAATDPTQQGISLHDLSFDPTPAASDRTVAADEDATYAFAAGDFGFVDAGGDALQKIRITQLESAGTLRWNGADVVLNQEIDVADIGLLTFQPAVNANGGSYADFRFGVSDGASYSVADYEMRIDVDAVNDAPTFGVLANQTLAEDAGAQSVTGFTTVAPGGGPDEAGQTFTYTVSNDNNALFTVQPSIAANGTLTYTAAANASGAATVTVFVTDSGGVLNGGDNSSPAQTFTLSVTPVADAPTLTVSPAAGNEDTAIALSIARSLVDTDGSETLALTVSGVPVGATLSDGVNSFTANAGNQNVVITAWNLAALTLTPPANSDVDFALTVSAFATEAANGAASTIANLAADVIPVNDTPVLGAVTLRIDALQTVIVTGGNMSATDIDNPAASLVFLVAGASNGQFEHVSAPGVAITTFTQGQIAAGEVRFVHTNAGFAPSFSIFASDGAAIAGPGVAVISFRGAGAEPPAPVRETKEPTKVVADASVLATGSAGLAQASAIDFFLRGSLAVPPPPAATFAEAPGEATVVLGRPVRAGVMLDREAGGPPSGNFVEADRIPTGLPKLDFAALPVRHDPTLPAVDFALGTARITGLALSAGAVWWATHAGGMLASLLATTPAWRHIDPLPVLGRDESKPDIDWDMPEKDPPEEETSEAEVFGERKVTNNLC